MGEAELVTGQTTRAGNSILGGYYQQREVHRRWECSLSPYQLSKNGLSSYCLLTFGWWWVCGWHREIGSPFLALQGRNSFYLSPGLSSLKEEECLVSQLTAVSFVPSTNWNFK